MTTWEEVGNPTLPLLIIGVIILIILIFTDWIFDIREKIKGK